MAASEQTLTLGFEVRGVDEFIEAVRVVMTRHRRARLPDPLFDMASIENDAGLTVTLTPTRRAAEWLRRWQER